MQGRPTDTFSLFTIIASNESTLSLEVVTKDYKLLIMLIIF